MTSNQQKNQHLMWRAGFGPAAAQLQQLGDLRPAQLYKAVQKASAKNTTYIDVADDYLKGFLKGLQEEGQRQKQLNADERKSLQQRQREGIKTLNATWLQQMVESEAQLREKMAFFWHGHFASRNINVFYQQDILHIIRQNALGSFRDLVHEVSKSAAMLNFLNAQQNRKGHPNENFAREVMELFTLGRGNYTENDIKEAARAFTGWGANIKGEFVFRKIQHDGGTKTIFGKTGNFTGEEVLDMLLNNKQTANYITQKIYKFFVNENIDQEKVSMLADCFYKSDYNIGQLMKDIFTSEWFYDEKNIGARIKSPIELIAGIQRLIPMQVENEDALLLLQRILGQTLFYPPNVAGWPGGKNWIDSSTLMVRLRIPQLISDNDELNIKPKADDDQMMGRMDDTKQKINIGRIGRLIKADVEWEAYTKAFEKVGRENLLNAISNSVLQVAPTFSLNLVKQHADESSRDAFIKSATIQLMSTPEYQMC